MDNIELSRKLSVERHDLDAAVFFNRYLNFSLGRHTDEFIYGRHMIMEELEKELQKLPRNAKILDVGCGTGHFSHFIQQKGFEVIGVEPAKNMINIARELFPGIHFVEGISASMPFPDETFDMILAIEVLRYLDKKDNLDSFIEFRRLLKPGGTIFVTQVNKYASDLYLPFYHVSNFFKKLFNKQRHFCFVTTAGEQQKMLQQSGFNRSEIIGRMYGFVRIFYKAGKVAGTFFTKLAEKINTKQHFTNRTATNTSGHLIVKGYRE
jgi:ubiquinone/menaquinone biosynthesis C-methylase UbiE